MSINRKIFFQQIKVNGLFTTLKTSQVKGIEVVLDKWDAMGYADLRWLAYMLATDYHETAKTHQAIEEIGKGRGRKYGKKIKHSGVPYTYPDKLYYGRGKVQLTWYENYQLMSRLLYGDDRLLIAPELALDLKVATDIMFEGMLRGSSSFGDFTGKCLEMYFNSTTEDWVGARKIINGTDRAVMIARYAKKFYASLLSAKE